MTRPVASIAASLAVVGLLLAPVAVGAEQERHPAIHKAENKLHAAKEDLEHAAHDFGGHRVKAIEHINAALEELKMALEFAKSERQEKGGKKQ